METFSVLLAICAGNSPVPGDFPTQRPATRRFDVFFDLRLNKRLNKQSWGWWFETLSRPLLRHCNVQIHIHVMRRVCRNHRDRLAPWATFIDIAYWNSDMHRSNHSRWCMITHPSPNFNCDRTKPPLKWRHWLNHRCRNDLVMWLHPTALPECNYVSVFWYVLQNIKYNTRDQ